MFDDDVLINRMLQSRYDNLVFDKLVKVGHEDSDVKRLRGLYRSTRAKQQRWEMLEEQAKRLQRASSRTLPLYSGRDPIDIVIEELVHSVKSHPKKRDSIFGHTETE